MSTTNVLFLFQPKDALHTYFKEGLKDYPNIHLIVPKDFEEATLLKHAPEADIMIGWRPKKTVLEAAKKLKVLINPGAGVQHHFEELVEVYKAKNIKLVNCHGNAYFTAQHTVAMLLSLLGQVIPHHNWMVEGKWRLGDKEAASTPFRNMTVGLCGFGNVNRYVYQMLKGFEVDFAIMKKRAFSAVDNALDKVKGMYGFNELHDFLKVIDILILAVPVTPETKGMIGAQELDILGKNGIIINVARGVVIHEEALYNSLKNNDLKGAALDVWYNYQVEEDEQGQKFPYSYPFYELDNVLLSPHRAASPYNDLGRWASVVQNLIDFSEGKESLENEVDLDLEY